MKHWYKLLLPLFVLVGFTATAQQRTCASHDVLLQEIAQDPLRAIQLEQIELFTKQFIANNPDAATRNVVTIPTVVHVVYNTTAQNVSDAMIQAQMNVLNEDFRMLNSDVSNTPSLFAGLAADCQIEFCLAQRDPNGNPTTGVTRTYTTKTSFSSNNAVKYTSQGGKDAWDRNQYLNIWICNLGNGLLGYAQFPGGSAATDGVVVLFSSLPGGSATNYNKGRTLTHEVGHWLNLRHIWGDANCGNDFVDDTPTQQTSNGGCPAFPKPSCGNTSDMHMNYMDYTYDACMYMFTSGQSTRMHAVLAPGGARYSLLSSLGCVPPGPVTCDVPASLSSFGVTSNAASVSWSAVSGAASYNLQYKTSAASTWTTVSTTATSYTLTNLASSTTYEFRVQALCGNTAGDYSAASSFTTQQAVTTCTDTYESNNSRTAAKVVPVNTTLYGLISPSGDNDWFRFSNTSSTPKIKVTLENLPADYDMQLYRNSTLISTAQLGGTTSETIKHNTTTVANNYYVRVYGYNGANNASQCYHLTISLASANWREMDEADFVRVEPGDFEVYPNPTSGKLAMDYLSKGEQTIQVRVVDLTGRTVLLQDALVTDGPNTVHFDLHHLANGLYMVQVVDGGGDSSKRVMLQR